MTDTTGKAALLIALCAAAAVLAGLVVGGGPMQARKENRDQDRLGDLLQISANIDCQVGVLRRLPDAPQTTEACPTALRLTDPHTGAPYDYARIDSHHWRICAAFELPQQIEPNPYGAQFDPERGCMVFSLPPGAVAETPVPD